MVLSTGKPMLMLLPYLYDTSLVGNSLTEWEFINNSLASSRHKVSACVRDTSLPMPVDAL